MINLSNLLGSSKSGMNVTSHTMQYCPSTTKRVVDCDVRDMLILVIKHIHSLCCLSEQSCQEVAGLLVGCGDRTIRVSDIWIGDTGSVKPFCNMKPDIKGHTSLVGHFHTHPATGTQNLCSPPSGSDLYQAIIDYKKHSINLFMILDTNGMWIYSLSPVFRNDVFFSELTRFYRDEDTMRKRVIHDCREPIISVDRMKQFPFLSMILYQSDKLCAHKRKTPQNMKRLLLMYANMGFDIAYVDCGNLE